MMEVANYISRFFHETMGQFSERYPTTVIHVFEGMVAFNLHAEMASMNDEWLHRFSEADKESSRMSVSIQTTVSKATLKDPSKQPSTPRRHIMIRFEISGSEPVLSGISYTSSEGKRWLRLFDTNKQHDVYN
jgi:hypothetical protein